MEKPKIRLRPLETPVKIQGIENTHGIYVDEVQVGIGCPGEPGVTDMMRKLNEDPEYALQAKGLATGEIVLPPMDVD